MVTIIWIRHAKKMYSNSKGPPGSYQHDPPLKPDQVLEIQSRAKELINLYGYPDKCYSSPYTRTRETTNILLSNIKEITPLYILPEIGEFLGNQRYNDVDKTPNVHPVTMSHNPIDCGENINNFKNRCNNHLLSLGLPDMAPTNEIIWIVTHGLVIRTICSILESYGINNEIKNGQIFDELSAVVLTQINKNSNLNYIPYIYKYEYNRKMFNNMDNNTYPYKSGNNHKYNYRKTPTQTYNYTKILKRNPNESPMVIE